MRRIRQVLQLHFGARIYAQLIALEVGVGRSTLQDYVARATGANLGWPLPPDLSDATIEPPRQEPHSRDPISISDGR